MLFLPHHSQRSYKGVGHEVTNIIHQQLRAVKQRLFVPFRQRPKRPADHLLTIRQREKETLRSYVKHFTWEILEVDEADHKVQLTTFKVGLKSREFVVSLAKILLRRWQRCS